MRAHAIPAGRDEAIALGAHASPRAWFSLVGAYPKPGARGRVRSQELPRDDGDAILIGCGDGFIAIKNQSLVRRD
jgi:hypothetical protein